MSGVLGTPGWTAPEIFKQEKYNEKVDIYSFAVVVSELVSGGKPYSGLNPMQIAFATVYQVFLTLRPLTSQGRASDPTRELPRSSASPREAMLGLQSYEAAVVGENN